MSKIALTGDALGTGTITVASPNTNSSITLTLPSSTGSNGQFLQTNGSGTLSFATVSQAQIYTDVFASSGTWTCPTGVTRVRVTVVGGGAGGGSSGSPSQGGIAIGVYTVTPGTNYTVTVGSGGTGVVAGTGGTGGTTSFGSTLISATGGTGSTATGTSTLGNIFNSASTPANVAGRSVLNTPLIGTASRTYTNAADQLAGLAWSTSSFWLPGARGNTWSVSCTNYASGGVGGAVFVEYVAP